MFVGSLNIGSELIGWLLRLHGNIGHHWLKHCHLVDIVPILSRYTDLWLNQDVSMGGKILLYKSQSQSVLQLGIMDPHYCSEVSLWPKKVVPNMFLSQYSSHVSPSRSQGQEMEEGLSDIDTWEGQHLSGWHVSCNVSVRHVTQPLPPAFIHQRPSNSLYSDQGLVLCWGQTKDHVNVSLARPPTSQTLL